MPYWATDGFRKLLLFGILGLTLIAAIIELAPVWRSRPDPVSEEDKISGSDAAEYEPAEPISATSKAAWPFHGELRNVKDYTPLNEKILAEPGYGVVLNYLSTAKPEDLKQSIKRFNYNNYFTETQNLRGEVVTIVGLIIRIDPIRLPKPISDTIDFMYRTYIVDTSATEACVLDLVRKPGSFEFRKDTIKTKGIFYKIVTYEGKKGREKEVPLCLGVQIDPYIPFAKDKTIGASIQDAIMTMMVIIGGIFLLGFTGYFVVRLMASRYRPKKVKTDSPKNDKPA